LYGLSIAGYAETKKLQDLDMMTLLVQSVSVPSWNNETRSIDGLSVLPETIKEYTQRFISTQGGNVVPNEVIDILAAKVPFFRKAVSVVVIVGVPNSKEGALKASHVKMLKEGVSRLFPRTGIRRYVVIPDASDRFSLGLIISGDGYLTSEVLHHVYNYLLNSFCIPGAEGTFIQKLESYLTTSDDDGSSIRDTMLEWEDLGPILAGLGDSGSFVQKRAELEARSVAILQDRVSFKEVLVTKQDVIDALCFVRDGIAYRGLRKAPMETILARVP